MQPSATIPPDEAARTLASVRAARDATRGQLASFWYPLVVFGVLTMLSAPTFQIWDGGGVALFWLIAAPVGTFLTIRHQRAEMLATGAVRCERSYSITACVLIAACFGLGVVGGVTGHDDIARFGPPLAISAAYLVFARLERNLRLAALASALAALTIFAAIADVGHASQALALGYGGSFVLLGLSERPRRPAA
ncbi:MAG: hypothetical protein QOG15_2794 [Solirubrobacteraceae bacterium]|jgi:hypothetical protein|nr:hypothetical protein [Solirubrobacteraceae bacterium]